MSAVPYIPESAPFSEDQRAWLNGFVAGLLSRDAAPQPGAAEDKEPLLVLFGSQSGNSESLAKQVNKRAAAKGFASRVVSLEDVEIENLNREKNVLVITSTWGEGEMPDNAATFWEGINQNGSSPKLEGINFSVLALGDMNYADTFCDAGKLMDKRLEELGGKRVFDRVDCDVDFDEPAEEWSEGVLTALLTKPAETQVSYSKKNPFPAALLVNEKLTGEASAKDTRHFALSLEGSGLEYAAGDALGVLSKNCPEVVDAIIAAHEIDPDAEVPTPGGETASLRQALIENYEIRTLLGSPKEKPASAEAFVEGLRKLQPRLYSIASSPKAHPGEVHLCVDIVRYEQDGVLHKGVASTFLAERMAEGETTGVFVHVAKGFRPPTNPDVPMIMVGPGTGIAPFRAFLEEREATGAKGMNWLFFGSQHRASDFFYEEQLTRWSERGLLTRLDLAFSRDQEEKLYVQNLMERNAGELWQRLEDGGHFYVCGDASRMAKDVDRALHQIIETAGGKTAEEAVAYVAAMKKEKRYARDVY